MLSRLRCLIIAVVMIIWISPVSSYFKLGQVCHGQISAEKVRDGIRTGVEFLFRKQQNNGSWQDVEDPNAKNGVTALVTLALLHSGVSPDHAKIKKAFTRLDSLPIESQGTYTVSLMAMAYAMNDPDTYAHRIRECVKYLEAGQLPNGGWTYTKSGRRGIGDGSNSQFALLALHEARLAGIEVSEEVWKNARTYWTKLRSGDNSYRYSKTTNWPPSGSMTAAGIASLIIVDENLAGSDIVSASGDIICCATDDWLIQVDLASKWIGDRFTVRMNPSDSDNYFRSAVFYYLYALERAGRLTGQRYFGESDWYREGAEYLMNIRKRGYWIGTGHGENHEEVATSFALLFLSKGRRPVVVGKYRHSKDNDWDRHRKGVHFLTRALEKDWQTKLNWQSVDGRVASTNDLLETPVLFLSGRDSLNLTDEQKKRLKEYVEYGRFIFAEACQGDGCGDEVEFDRKFRELMAELFPENPLQELPESHPIWNSQHKLLPNPDRPLLGVQTSCRTAVVYVPANLSGYWQADRPGVREKLNARASEEVDYCLKLGINVIAYATGRELRDRLDSPKVVESSGNESITRTIVIPKLIHGGGSNDAPNAWQNILRRAKLELKQEFLTEQKFINVTTESLSQNPIVFMHGRNNFEFKEAERRALREHLLQDGTLFADCICASTKFAQSFRDEMQKIFPEPEIRLQRLPPDHPLFTDRLGGFKLNSVTIKRPGANGVTQRTGSPQLEAITIDGRLVVVFSPFDLSCAMENAAASTCEGYSKEDASKIGVNVLLYLLSQ